MVQLHAHTLGCHNHANVQQGELGSRHIFSQALVGRGLVSVSPPLGNHMVHGALSISASLATWFGIGDPCIWRRHRWCCVRIVVIGFRCHRRLSTKKRASLSRAMQGSVRQMVSGLRQWKTERAFKPNMANLLVHDGARGSASGDDRSSIVLRANDLGHLDHGLEVLKAESPRVRHEAWLHLHHRLGRAHTCRPVAEAAPAQRTPSNAVPATSESED